MALENTTACTEKETHDFMNVESFSQLPFIRPHATASSKTSKEKPIRLFGIEFGISSSAAVPGDDSSADENNNNNEEEEETSRQIKENESNSSSSSNNNSRRFECHYCCRNFPTSQALGGHQNAHKRERQHAKRAHLHSAGHLADAHHIYGLINYTAGIGSGPNNITSYPSWTTSNSRLYGAHHRDYQSPSNYFSQAQAQAPINGSPLGLLRIPGASSVQSRHLSFNLDRPMLQHQQQNPLPLFGSSSLDHQVVFGGSSTKTMQSSSSSSRFLFHETKPSSHDHVSLDLHL